MEHKVYRRMLGDPLVKDPRAPAQAPVEDLQGSGPISRRAKGAATLISLPQALHIAIWSK
jgi:hypothetical protein